MGRCPPQLMLIHSFWPLEAGLLLGIPQTGRTKVPEDTAEERHRADSCVYCAGNSLTSHQVHWITSTQKISLLCRVNFERRTFIYIYDKLSFK